MRPTIPVKLPPNRTSLAVEESSDQNIVPTILEVTTELDIQPQMNENKQFVLYTEDFARFRILNTFLQRSIRIGKVAISALENGATTQAMTYTQLLNLLKSIDPAREIPASEVAVLVENLNRIVGDVDKTRAYLQMKAKNRLKGWGELKNDMREAGLALYGAGGNDSI
jgi:hypothetical protein